MLILFYIFFAILPVFYHNTKCAKFFTISVTNSSGLTLILNTKSVKSLQQKMQSVQTHQEFCFFFLPNVFRNLHMY